MTGRHPPSPHSPVPPGRDTVRWIAGAMLLAALALRLLFLLSLPARALYWDEPAYATAAERYRAAWSASTGGGAPTLGEAFAGSLQRGEVYAATVALVYTIFGPHPTAVFVLQAFFDTATCLLLFGLARAVGGVRAGLIALALSALYAPFVFATARLQTETMACLLCIGGLWAICVPRRRRRLGLFCAGVAIAAAMLTRPAMQGLFFVLLPAVVVRDWDRAGAQRLLSALVFAGGFFCIVAPRLLLTAMLTGGPVWSGRLDPSVDMYGGAIVGNSGWKTDGIAFASPPRDELLAVLGDPPTRHWTVEDMRRATIRTWLRHPLQSGAIMLHKLYEAWLHPYNDSRWTFPGGEHGVTAAHRILLVLALIGMPLALHRWRIAVPLVLATLYLWLTYLVVKIEVRYAVTAMPLMVCFAAVALAQLSDGWQREWRGARRRRVVGLAAATGVGLWLAIGSNVARISQIAPVSAETALGVRVAILLAFIVGVAIVAAHLVGRERALALFVPPAALAAAIATVGWPLEQNWREWRCTLSDGGVVRQEFFLPPGVEPPLSATLKLDLLPSGSGCDVVVRVNGVEARRFQDGLQRLDADLPSKEYYRDLFAARRRDQQPEAAWYPIEISPALFSPGDRLAVEVSVEGGGRDAALVVLGDFPPDATTYVGPSLLSPALLADTSIYRYLAEDDFRMRRSILLAGASRSARYDGAEWTEEDLAPDGGRQRGRYRIFLLLTYPRGIVVL